MDKKDFPLASFCIVAYKAEKYIEEAIDAAFAQDYPNLEIIMSDDGSPDRTFEIMQEKAAAYKGPHRIILNRNEPNLGPRENYNKVMYELSHGDYVLFADGDDISRADRTRVCVELMQQHPDVMSMSVQSRFISADGVDYELKRWEQLSEHKYSVFTLADYVNYPFMMFSGDSRVLRREVINKFPPLKFSYSEDVFLFVRSLYLGSIIYLREPLVRYRQHTESIMAKSKAKKRSKLDVKHWESRSARQLREDFQYAVDRGYLSEAEKLSMSWKLETLIDFLRPKRKTFLWRIIRRISKYSNKLFSMLLKCLE